MAWEAAAHNSRLQTMRYLGSKMRSSCNLYDLLQLGVEETEGDLTNGGSVWTMIHQAEIIALEAAPGEDLCFISSKYIIYFKQWEFNTSPLDVRPPPLPGSSISIFSSFGVFSSSPSESLMLARPGGLKFSTVRVSMSPPLAVSFSSISIGGGS